MEKRTALSKNFCCSSVNGRLRFALDPDLIASGSASVAGGDEDVVIGAWRA